MRWVPLSGGGTHIDALKPFMGDNPEEWLHVMKPPSESFQTNKEAGEGENGVPATLGSSPDREDDEQEDEMDDEEDDDDEEEDKVGEIEAKEETGEPHRNR